MKNIKNILSIDILNEFSQNLKKELNNLGLSPYGAAIKLGLDKKALKTVLKYGCDPKFSTVVKIAKGLEISLNSLVGINDRTVDEKTTLKQNAPILITTESSDICRKDIKELVIKLKNIHENDVEILSGIADVLGECRVNRLTRVINSVKNVHKKRTNNLYYEDERNAEYEKFDSYEDNLNKLGG